MSLRNVVWMFAVIALVGAGCGEDKTPVDENPLEGSGGTGGIGGDGGGTGGTPGTGGDGGGTGGVPGTGGDGGEGTGGSGGFGTGGSGGFGAGGSGGSGGDPGVTCGNGIVDGDEECDGDAIPGACTDHDFDGGELGCTSTCTLDTSGCFHEEICDDGIDNDGDGDVDCDDSDCAEAFNCPSCGNGVIQEGEDCDSTPPLDQTCADHGFDAGTLACDPVSCEVDASKCRNVTCGDTIVEGDEECDDGNLDPGDGCNEHCQLEGDGCTLPRPLGTEHYDASTSTWTVQGDTTGYSTKVAATCAPSMAHKDVIFTFEPPANGLYAAEVQSTHASLITVWNDACAPDGEEIGCVIGDGLLQLEGGQPVHLVVDGAGSGIQEGPFTLTVEQRTHCGDGVVQAGEGCDFGDVTPGDGCSEFCEVEPNWTCDDQGCYPPSCGNGQIDIGEMCDDGNTNDNDGCDSNCMPEWVQEGQHNNAFASSDVLEAWAGTGAITPSGEFDFWILPVDAGKQYRVRTFTAPDGSCGSTTEHHLRLTLYEDRQERQDVIGSSPNLCAELTFTATANVWHLAVRGGLSNNIVPIYYFLLEEITSP